MDCFRTSSLQAMSTYPPRNDQQKGIHSEFVVISRAHIKRVRTPIPRPYSFVFEVYGSGTNIVFYVPVKPATYDETLSDIWTQPLPAQYLYSTIRDYQNAAFKRTRIFLI